MQGAGIIILPAPCLFIQPQAHHACFNDVQRTHMKDTDIQISLAAVGELEGGTALNRRALRRLTKQPIVVDMSVKAIPDLKRSLITLVVSCSYRAVIGFIRERLMVCSAVATFEVADLAGHIERRGEEAVVGGSLMMTMLGIAVGALRGIVAVRTAGTPLHNRPLPIIDLSALMYRLHYGSSAPAAFPL